MSGKPSIPRVFLLCMVLVSTVSCLVIGYLWISDEYRRFEAEAATLRADHLKSRRRQMKERVEEAVQFIEFKRRQTEQRTRQVLRERVRDAHNLATHLCETCRGARPQEEIEDLVREALRPIRFNNGRGYYFATRLDGVETLFADRPELEGDNLLGMRDTRGAYVIRDMIALVREHGEGFYSYTWTKPGAEGREHLKLSFVKHFEPFDWFIGAGEYLEDVERDLQGEALDWISRVRYDREGYLFVGQWDGTSLSGPSRGENMIDIVDANGVAIVRELIERARRGGGYVSYVMPRFEGFRPAPKISYAQGVPEWEWYVGTGLYVDDIERTLSALREERYEELEWNILKSCFVLGLLWAGSSLIALWIARRTHASFAAFSRFFDRASGAAALSTTEGFEFAEFEGLAESANRMVTRRQRAEREARDAREFLETALAQSPAGILIADAPDVRIRMANQAAFGIRGGPPSILTDIQVAKHAERWQTFRLDGAPYPPERLPLSRAVLEGEIVRSEEVVIRNEQGEDRAVIANAAPIRDGEGRVVAGIVVFQDITDRKRAEEALRESEERLRFLFEKAADAIYVCTRDGQYVQVNEQACAKTGYTEEELMRLNVADVDADLPSRAAMASFFDTLRVGRPVTIESHHRRKDGSTFPVEITVALIETPEGPRIIGIARDITERKRAEEQHDRLEEQLRQSQKMEAIGQLTGGVAHDFNNLLQVINGAAEMATDDIPPDHPARGQIDEVVRAGERAARLVSQLLAFSRRQIMRPVHQDLNQTVSELLKMIRRVIGEHIRVEWAPAPDLGSIYADRGMIEQVLMNLCVNARDAMPDGGTITIETRNVLIDEAFCALHSWATPGRCVLLTVSDTGCGMEEGMLEHIFEPFFTTKEQGKGTGLGLATVYGIVRQHDGMITVESEPDVGSTFRIYLPVRRHEADTVEDDSQIAAAGGPETVLLVEDDDAVRDLSRQFLVWAGYRVFEARNGVEAVALFNERADEIDLAILDVVMPIMGGREAYEVIRERRPDLRAIFVTGYTEDAVHRNFVLEKGLTLLQKPYARDVLLQAVRKSLDDAPEY